MHCFFIRVSNIVRTWTSFRVHRFFFGSEMETTSFKLDRDWKKNQIMFNIITAAN